MNQDTGPNQAEPAEVPEVAQSACTTPPTETSTAPVRVRQTRKPRPKPEAEAPVKFASPESREAIAALVKKHAPSRRPVTHLDREWTFDDNPDGRAVAIQLGGAA